MFTCVCFKVLVYECVSKFLSPCVCLKALFTCVCFKVLVYECVSKFLSPCVCLKALVYQLCVSKLLSTFVYIKVLVYKCMFQSSCLPIVCLKTPIYFCLHQSSCLLVSVSKLISTIVYLHEFWTIYEFWNSSQAWFTLPYNICKSVWKVMNFQVPQSSSSMCHNLFVGTIIVGEHKRNVSPQNHSHDTTLNDHYVYWFIYFGEFIFSFNTHILCD